METLQIILLSIVLLLIPVIGILSIIVENQKTDNTALMDTAHINAILQDSLELIANNTEENAQAIAQETLEAISVNNNKE